MTIVVDYQMGNVGSMFNMLNRIQCPAAISNDPDVIASAERLILPGVGAFDAGMERLGSMNLIPALEHAVLTRGVPILGVCLGMQLFGRSSEEGASAGLGWIPAHTVRFGPECADKGLKIPHMGWNEVHIEQEDTLFAGLDDARFYHVHSYHLVCDRAETTLAVTTHGSVFTTAIREGNIFGTQFHPEKSHRYGMQLLKNFVETC